MGNVPPDAVSSFDLLDQARKGDSQALDRLLARYLPRLRRWASGRLPTYARSLLETDDVVQESLVRALRHLEGFEPRHDGAFQAYLRQAVLNRIADEVRKAARRAAPQTLPTDAAASGPTPLEEAIGTEALERYEAALQRLRPQEQDAIVLRIELGYDYVEMAREMGKSSPDAARMAVSRALVCLAREMSRGR